ncbi:MAG: CapA family protein [Bacteroidales bacterium]|nr:CapA family protein [Bacteroidales bacterium]MCF8402538.1 CapA family protein [Bacteroidales bacterium]
MINILFTGDLAPLGGLKKVGSNLSNNIVDKRIYGLFNKTDINIVNLETPMTNASINIEKSGPHLKSKPSNIEVLKNLQVNIACLSNNHIRDFGDSGVIETIEVCKNAGVKTVGAGVNAEEAAKPLFIEAQNKKICFLNFSESEFNYATDFRAGSNPDEIINIINSIKAVTKKCDYIIVVLHGGKEMHPHPTPYQLKLFRFIADQGVHAIIGHHTHVIGGYEVYNGIPIVYSLGNFLFDEPGNAEAWYYGAIAFLGIETESNTIRIDFKYVKLENGKLVLLSEPFKDFRMKAISEDQVNTAWQNLIQKQGVGTIKSILNLSLMERLLLKLKLKNLSSYKSKLIPLGNRMRCKTHQMFTIDAIDHFTK